MIFYNLKNKVLRSKFGEFYGISIQHKNFLWSGFGEMASWGLASVN